MKKEDGKQKEMKSPEPERTNIMPGPYPPPPPPPQKHDVSFRFWIGDYVEVSKIGFWGIIKAVAVDQSEGHVYLVDNGSEEKWYADSLLDYGYIFKDEGPETSINE